MNPVAVGAKRYALGLGFLDCGWDVVIDYRKAIHRLLVFANDMMKVDNSWVAIATMGTSLACLIRLPFVPFTPSILADRPKSRFAVFQIPLS